MAYMKPVAQIRRERLAQLIREDFGGNGAALAAKTGKDRRQISAWLNYKDMRDETAREIERACMKPSGWLEHDETFTTVNGSQPLLGSSRPVRTDRNRMRDVTTLLGALNELQAGPAALTSDPDAIAATYDFLSDFGEPVTEGNLMYLCKIVAAMLKGGSANGDPQRGET